MSEPIPQSPSHDSRWFGWLIGLGLGLVGCAFLWRAGQQLIEARILLGATFEFPRLEIAIAQLLFLLAGVAFAVIMLMACTGNRSRRIGLLIGGAVAPLGLLLYQWAWVSRVALPSSVTQTFRWSIDNAVQSVAAVAVAGLLTTLAWTSIASRRSQPHPLVSRSAGE